MVENNLGELMNQARQMQEKVQNLQNDIANAQVIGESGGGLIRVTMTGRHDVKRVEIDDSLFSADKDVLEDLIAAAMNDAVRRAEQYQQDKMSELTGGISLPPGFKFPFS